MPDKKRARAKKAEPAPPKVELPDMSRVRSIETMPDDDTISGESVALTPQGGSERLMISGHDLLLHKEKSCKICNLGYPWRGRVESAILAGAKAAYLNELIPEGKVEHPINRDNVRNHTNRHMELSDAMDRAMLEDHEDQLADDLKQTGSILTVPGVMHMFMRRAYEQMAAGNLKITGGDFVAGARLLKDIEEGSTHNLDQGVWAARFVSTIEATLRYVPEHLHASFLSEIAAGGPLASELLKRNPVPSDNSHVVEAVRQRAIEAASIDWSDVGDGEPDAVETIDDTESVLVGSDDDSE